VNRVISGIRPKSIPYCKTYYTNIETGQAEMVRSTVQGQARPNRPGTVRSGQVIRRSGRTGRTGQNSTNRFRPVRPGPGQPSQACALNNQELSGQQVRHQARARKGPRSGQARVITGPGHQTGQGQARSGQARVRLRPGPGSTGPASGHQASGQVSGQSGQARNR
jgi:hypothetical protein